MNIITIGLFSLNLTTGTPTINILPSPNQLTELVYKEPVIVTPIKLPPNIDLPPLESKKYIPLTKPKLDKPLYKYIVSSDYGPRWGRNHNGIDLATAYGTPVVASSEGSVVESEYINGYGLTVVLEHNEDLDTLYAHLSKTYVSVGASVSKGDVLGEVGCSGNCTGPHLHFEVREKGAPVNPRVELQF